MDSRLIASLLGQIPEGTQDNPDYDFLGYVKKYGIPDQSKGQHLTDEYKLPNHITFSDQSRYSAPDMQGGTWQSGGQNLWNFMPSEFNLQQHPIQQLLDYFKNKERKGTYVTGPKGKRAQGQR
jgi:hypothetical protein